ncbi:MAG: hypothetical protein MRJ93_10285 [Nitrososphaeraceae archaeon]|nr:hypothetical protein [Nitrososphaeraceae archaeon]
MKSRGRIYVDPARDVIGVYYSTNPGENISQAIFERLQRFLRDGKFHVL